MGISQRREDENVENYNARLQDEKVVQTAAHASLLHCTGHYVLVTMYWYGCSSNVCSVRPATC